MLAISAGTRCFVCVEPQNFRKGIDGMSAVVRQRISHDPMSGAVYLFRNNARTSIKILFYDGSAFWLCQRRLSAGRLKWWPEHQDQDNAMTASLTAREIQVILWNGDPTQAQFTPEWRKLT
jgi:transposase